ncbi:hypothetical protein FRB99_006279, partial [Tulasnella sp. 403]
SDLNNEDLDSDAVKALATRIMTTPRRHKDLLLVIASELEFSTWQWQVIRNAISPSGDLLCLPDRPLPRPATDYVDSEYMRSHAPCP